MLNKSLAAILFVAACGLAACTDGPKNEQPDARDYNTAITTAGKAGAKADVHVVFVNADGKVAADVKTDANGWATATVEPGASVTAEINGLTTILGVQPGDGLTIQVEDPKLGKDKGSLAVAFATEAGATGYTLISPCTNASSATSPASLPVHSNCGANDPLLAVATDANGTMAYAIDKKVSIAKGDYTLAGKWQTADAYTVNVSGIDAAKQSSIKAQLATQVGYVTDKATVATSAATAAPSLKGALKMV